MQSYDFGPMNESITATLFRRATEMLFQRSAATRRR
jgi:hypothetical protein